MLHSSEPLSVSSRESNEFAGQRALSVRLTCWDVADSHGWLRFAARVDVVESVAGESVGCWDHPEEVEAYAQALTEAAREMRALHNRQELRDVVGHVEASETPDIPVPANTSPIGEVSEYVSHMRARGLSERTVSERQAFLARLGEQTGNDVAALTTQDLQAWLAEQPGLAASSRSTYFAILRAWFEWLVTNGHRDDDPTVRLGKPKAPRGRPRPLSSAQVENLLASGIRRKTRAMILLAAYQGLRVHEIAKFRGEDVNLIDGTLDVTGKGGVRETLPLHPEVAQLADTFPRSGLWFTAQTDSTQPMNSKSVSTVIAQAMKRAGINGTAHQLRHWYGTELVRSGADLRTTQSLMRHANLNTTAIYTQVDSERQNDAIRRLPTLEP